jgi:hypothetical protein
MQTAASRGPSHKTSKGVHSDDSLALLASDSVRGRASPKRTSKQNRLKAEMRLRAARGPESLVSGGFLVLRHLLRL